MMHCQLIRIILTSILLVGFSYSSSWALEISHDARKHMFRGQAAMEVAKNISDYQDAVKEFKEAVQYAPDWADAWYNLGVAQEEAEDYANAIESFNKYLELNPNASDSSEVEGRIFKLEYKAEHRQKEKVISPEKKETARDESYIKFESGVVYDTRTGLEWFVGPDQDTNFYEAKAWVENLNVAGGGWRMPTGEELKTLYKKGVGDQNMTSLLTSGIYVPKRPGVALHVWSGETGYSSQPWARDVSFFDTGVGYGGYTYQHIPYHHRAFAVRYRK